MSYQAVFHNQVIAQTDTWQEVEGNIYFPAESINWQFFTETATTTSCPWKGQASYYTLKVDDQELPDAAWTYHQPLEKAQHITDHVAFYSDVEVKKTD